MAEGGLTDLVETEALQPVQGWGHGALGQVTSCH